MSWGLFYFVMSILTIGKNEIVLPESLGARGVTVIGGNADSVRAQKVARGFTHETSRAV